MDESTTHYLPSCDTMVAFTGPHDARHAVFAKNSDRPPLECQPLTQVAAADHPSESTVQCQYLTIPQASHTLAVLGSRPSWLWGFEHGVNEAGVAIGNEAIYCRDPVPAEGLLGMDLVRLALERGSTAAEAKDVITRLLERYGQGGSAVAGSDRRYHNSFIVADRSEAWVIETSAGHWVARRTTDGAVISNLVTMEDDWDECSVGLAEHARTMGYWSAPDSTRLNFRVAFEDPASRAGAEPRIAVGQRLLAESDEFSVAGMMRHLRDHGEAGPVNTPLSVGSPAPDTVCMHPGGSEGTTAASMIVDLAADLPPVAWVSMAAPCTGVFVPVTVGQPLPAALTAGDERPDTASLWWAMREVQFSADRDPARLTPLAQEVWGPLERRLLADDPRLSRAALADLVSEVLRSRDQVMINFASAASGA